MSLVDRLRALPLQLLPQRLSSRLVYRLARVRTPWIKNPLIRAYIRLYRVAMDEAAEPDPHAYPNFNAFFTRTLKPGARPVASEPDVMACPVDGTVSQLGYCDGETLIQAKGQHYTLTRLLGGDAEQAAAFRGGAYATLYLSPRDYHRIHMPLAGELRHMVHIPGRLFSVSPTTTRAVAEIFARNERLAVLFDTRIGPMAVILVGAINVGSLETLWGGPVAASLNPRVWRYPADGAALRLERGEELGRFNLGSTVILLFPGGRVRWRAGLGPGDPVRMGQRLADLDPA